MAVLDIKTYGAGVLRRKAKPIDQFGPRLEKLVKEMFETMYASNGIGLAAPQVGLGERLIVVDIEEIDAAFPPLALVNPELSEFEGSVCADEGCLSFPGLQGTVSRAEKVHVKAQTPKGDKLEFDADGWMARVLQHEVDHLDGVLFIDHLGEEQRGDLKEDLQLLRSGQIPRGDDS